MGAQPDISTSFRFETIERSKYVYKMGSGDLGIPGTVMLHRTRGSQSSVSSGTGDDAGHLIGNRFGTPGGTENLGPQNWIQNRYGTFRQLENIWEMRLKGGIKIRVLVQDVYRKDAHGNIEGRPFMRRVEWDEKLKNGLTTHQELTFANPQTAKSRAAREIDPSTAAENIAKVFDFFSGKRLTPQPRRQGSIPPFSR
jgi:hypothetical protein